MLALYSLMGCTRQRLPAAAVALLSSGYGAVALLPSSAAPPAAASRQCQASSSSRSFCSSNSSSSTSSSSSGSQQVAASSNTPRTQAASSSSSSSTKQQYRVLSSRQLQEIRARIFEQHVGDGRRSGRKALLRPLKGRHIADWYFTLTGPQVEMQPDDIEEERVFKTQLARATGGGPPKKGQGKRSKR